MHEEGTVHSCRSNQLKEREEVQVRAGSLHGSPGLPVDAARTRDDASQHLESLEPPDIGSAAIAAEGGLRLAREVTGDSQIFCNR